MLVDLLFLPSMMSKENNVGLCQGLQVGIIGQMEISDEWVNFS